MRQLLITAFKETVEQIKADAALMPLTRWNESVFRFVYSRAVAKLDPRVTQFAECSRIDLVLRRKTDRAFVEFKFYLRAAKYDPLFGNKIGWKGGPGRKNHWEFKKCVQTLRRRYRGSKVSRLVILFYCDPPTGRTFDAYYGEGSGVERKLKIRQLDSIGPFSPNGSESRCNARLFEVRA